MRRIIITLRTPGDQKGRDLEMPTDVPIAELMPEIVDLLGWKAEKAAECALILESSRQVIKPTDTLQAAGITMADRLSIQDGYYPSAAPGTVSEGAAAPDKAHAWHGAIPILVSASGEIYPMRDPRTEIGRTDPAQDVYADIDLGKEDPDRYIHRRHARITREEDVWCMEPYAGVRPDRTAVNDKPVAPGTSIPLHFGDKIRISKVELTFREG